VRTSGIESVSSRRLGEQALAALEELLPSFDPRRAGTNAPLSGLDDGAVYEELCALVLRAAASDQARARGLSPELLIRESLLFDARRFRLLDRGELHPSGVASAAHLDHETELPIEALGTIYEALSSTFLEREPRGGPARLSRGRTRKQTGTFFTPAALAQAVVERALERLVAESPGPERVTTFRVCDPACGAAVFLIEAGRQLSSLLEGVSGETGAAARRRIARSCLFGVDRSELAVAVAEASLWLWVGDESFSPAELRARLRVGDSLLGPRWDRAAPEFAIAPGSAPCAGAAPVLDWARELAEIYAGSGFDLVLGNPPWVAFAGRAAQPLDPRLRAHYRASYDAWRGYPTLHGLFIERATELAPDGVVALVVPSPIADLDGYRATRRAATRRHAVREPLLEFGQDAFAAVTQPCFALVLDPAPDSQASDRPWRLAERQRTGGVAEELQPPPVLARLRDAAPLPPELFGEMGFQSCRIVTQELFLRAATPARGFDYPLLEGRDVGEFRVGSPRLFLRADREVLRRARCRLRAPDDYDRVSFVVRQTAPVPIAARCSGVPFRNSLLAGFAREDLEPDLIVGLLNSTLYRALHLAARRDARQAAFPQVKVSHLRALPRPPDDRAARARVSELASCATRAGLDAALGEQLDRAVFDLFAVSDAERDAVRAFMRARASRFARG
jgi:hypothetical protein